MSISDRNRIEQKINSHFFQPTFFYQLRTNSSFTWHSQETEINICTFFRLRHFFPYFFLLVTQKMLNEIVKIEQLNAIPCGPLCDTLDMYALCAHSSIDMHWLDSWPYWQYVIKLHLVFAVFVNFQGTLTNGFEANCCPFEKRCPNSVSAVNLRFIMNPNGLAAVSRSKWFIDYYFHTHTNGTKITENWLPIANKLIRLVAICVCVMKWNASFSLEMWLNSFITTALFSMDWRFVATEYISIEFQTLQFHSIYKKKNARQNRSTFNLT